MISNLLIAFLGVFAGTTVLGAILLPLLRRSKLSQREREFGSKTHLTKSGTPTFGGLMFLIPLAALGIGSVFFAPEANLLPLTIYMLGIGAVGFVDDYTKVKIKKEGLSPRAKSLPLLLITAFFVMYYLDGGPIDPFIINPFTMTAVQVSGLGKAVYGFFLLIYLYAVSNSVNLTDGVDGLLSMVTIPVSLALVATSFVISETPTSRGTGLMSIGLTGALLGFLIYNRHTAKVFMGDTGSLAIGALVGALAMIQGIPWIMLLYGIVYVCESLSVIIQVAYFKRTKGKRIFRMSPIHHHFELGGWSEWKVCVVFTLVSLAGCLLGLLTLRGYFLM
jgi:phospho-N-acetylmuramoyl-pentapeptide-transferase